MSLIYFTSNNIFTIPEKTYLGNVRARVKINRCSGKEIFIMSNPDNICEK